MITDVNSEDRLVQETFAGYLRDAHGWDSVYAYNNETFGNTGMLGRDSEREVVLSRDLLQAVQRLNHEMPEVAHAQAVENCRGSIFRGRSFSTIWSSMTSFETAFPSNGEMRVEISKNNAPVSSISRTAALTTSRITGSWPSEN